MRITAHVRSRKQELYAHLNSFQTPTPPEIAIPWYDNHFYPLQCVQSFGSLQCAIGTREEEEEEEEKKKKKKEEKGKEKEEEEKRREKKEKKKKKKKKQEEEKEDEKEKKKEEEEEEEEEEIPLTSNCAIILN